MEGFLFGPLTPTPLEIPILIASYFFLVKGSYKPTCEHEEPFGPSFSYAFMFKHVA